jgi:hypothetical protein
MARVAHAFASAGTSHHVANRDVLITLAALCIDEDDPRERELAARTSIAAARVDRSSRLAMPIPHDFDACEMRKSRGSGCTAPRPKLVR